MLITIREFAERLGVDMVTVRRWHRAGLLIPAKVDPRLGRFYDEGQLPKAREVKDRSHIPSYKDGLIYAKDILSKTGMSREVLFLYVKRGLVSPQKDERGRYVFSAEEEAKIVQVYNKNCGIYRKGAEHGR